MTAEIVRIIYIFPDVILAQNTIHYFLRTFALASLIVLRETLPLIKIPARKGKLGRKLILIL